MRDVKRIQPLLTAIGDVWERYFTDMRFMQLITNFQNYLHSDGFYIEDDELIEKFYEFVTDMTKRG